MMNMAGPKDEALLRAAVRPELRLLSGFELRSVQRHRGKLSIKYDISQ
jgi:hypothetical protein